MILVTHYLEEIMPAFSHVFLLKSGRCAAKGEKERILRRDLLTQAFDISIEAGSDNGRYWSIVRRQG
jgi:iron complex transport system ATP-binding protein